MTSTANSVGGASIPGELVTRLEVAEAGSVELDSVIFRHFGGPLPKEFATYRVDLEWQDDGSAVMPVGDLQVRYTPPAYTTSLDAALALAERVVPGWVTDCDATAPEMGIDWSIHHPKNDPDNPRRQFTGTAATHALALCIAILKATTAPEAGAVGTTEGREPEKSGTREGADR